jgi:peptidoglycan/xylan/chitin deacetylase (PgdA/CDA1 family)
MAAVNICLAALMLSLSVAIGTPAATSAMGALYDSPVYRGREKGVIGLECAVSWNAAALPALLDTLKQRGIAITFLVSGEWAEENGELLRRMTREGHELGTMGYDPMRDGNAQAVFRDVEKALRAIQAVCGVRPALYYSGGRGRNSSAGAARRLGLKHVLCTADLLSGRGDAKDILLRALDKPFDGSIFLLQPTAQAVKAAPAIIEGLMRQGFRVGAVGEALGEYTR